MRYLFHLKPERLLLIKPYFPRSHGIARVDEKRVKYKTTCCLVPQAIDRKRN